MDKKDQNQKLAKHKRVKVWLIAILLIVILVLFLFWKMLFYTPSGYKPARPDNPEQVSPYLTHKLAPDFYNNIQLDDPFNILIEQQGLNDIVARGDFIVDRCDWPIDAGFAIIQTPVIVFAPDEITLMAQMNFGKYPVVTTVKLNPAIDDDGMFILNLQDVKAGAVNITPMAKTLIVNLIDSELNAAPADVDYKWLKDIKDAVIDNVPFDPLFPIDENSSKYIRLSGIDMKDQKLTLLLTPVNK